MEMKGYNDIAGIVLAGGTGSRLGEDKCCIRFSFAAGEHTLLEHSMKLLLCVLPEVHIIGRECEGKSWFPDGVPGKGPVGGIATALKLLAKPCLVLPVDLPFMNGRLLRALLDARMLRRPEDVVTCLSAPL